MKCTAAPGCKCAECDGTVEILCSHYAALMNELRTLRRERRATLELLRRAEEFIKAELQERLTARFKRTDPEYRTYIATPRALLSAISKGTSRGVRP